MEALKSKKDAALAGDAGRLRRIAAAADAARTRLGKEQSQATYHSCAYSFFLNIAGDRIAPI